MSLIAWYPFTTDTLCRGGANGAALGSVLDDNGKLGKCFNSKTNTAKDTGIVMVNDWNLLQNSVSMSCWVRFNKEEIATQLEALTLDSGHATPNGCLIGYTSYGGVGIHWMSNTMFVSGAQTAFTELKLFGYIRGLDASGGAYLPIIGYYSAPFDTWIHLTFVCNKSDNIARLYVNGTEFKTATFKDLASWRAQAGNFSVAESHIYSGNGPGQKLPCKLNDVRLYDHALSIAEIKELARGKIFHYSFDHPQEEATVNLVSGVQSGGRTTADTTNLTITTTGLNQDTYFYLNTSEALVQGETYTISCWGENIGEDLSFIFGIGAQASGNPRFTIKDGYNATTFVCSAAGAVSRILFDDTGRTGWQSQATFSKFQIEKKDHATPYVKNSREAEILNNGLLQDADSLDVEIVSDAKVGSHAARFNGMTSYIDTPFIKSNLLTDDYTLSFWVKPIDDGRAVYFGDYGLTNGTTYNIERSAGGSLRFWYGGGTNGEINLSNMNSPVNVWTMLTITYNAATKTLKFYKNGAYITSAAYTATRTKSGGSMRIGRDSREATEAAVSSNTPLYGYIDDFRLYSTVLSDLDIANLHSSGVAVDKNKNLFTNEIIEQSISENMVNANSWEQGGINDSGGANANGMNNRLRTNYIPVIPNSTYYCKAVSTHNVRGVHYYTKENTWISAYLPTTNAITFTTPANCHYVRWVIQNKTASTNCLLADIETFKPVMLCTGAATDMPMNTTMNGIQINNTMNINTKNICEEHDIGFYQDGAVSANSFYEI